MALPPLFTDTGDPVYSVNPPGVGGTTTINGGGTVGGQTPNPTPSLAQQPIGIISVSPAAPLPGIQPATATVTASANDQSSALPGAVAGIAGVPSYVLVIAAVIAVYFLFKE